jgi:hypothetical protein
MDIRFDNWSGASRAALQPQDHKAVYDDVVREARARSAADPDRAEHRQILRDLVGETNDAVPFPTSMVEGNDRYFMLDEVIDVAPHAFELAKLIDKLNWSMRLALTEGAGSATKMPDLLASRGTSGIAWSEVNRLVATSSNGYDEIRDFGFASTVVGGGSCGNNASAIVSLAQSLDDDMLKDMGVNVDLSKLLFIWMQDPDCDHSYAAVHHGDDGEVEMNDPAGFHNLWSIDSHQLYPMPVRYDQSLYNHTHLDATIAMPGPRVAHPDPQHTAEALRLDLGAARAARESLEQKLGRGWIDREARQPTHREIRQHPEVASAMRDQGVSDYMQIDTSTVADPIQREALEKQIADLDRNVKLRIFAEAVENGNVHVHEQWQGLCLPINPNAVYRNSATGEILAPTVPTAYLERTERARWAWDVYKNSPQASAEITPAPDAILPPAVEAIEQEPFLGALAAARAMDFSANSLYAERLPDYVQALNALEQWVDRMHNEASESLVSRISATGLQGEVVQSLAATQRNLDVLEHTAAHFAARSEPGSETHAMAAALRVRVANSKAQEQLAELSTTVVARLK